MKPICDIILLSYESPELLKKCVESVLFCTNTNSRLIIVDNNSQDKRVKTYLNGIHGNGTVQIDRIFSDRNEGFARGINKGLRLSDAPFASILNNDCVVSQGWLEELISVAASSKKIGLVNPQSSTFGSRPDGLTSINEHARGLLVKKGKFVELGHAIGFALLIKREVIEKIGYLDESYEGVCYEDTDYSLRAGEAGYISVMAEGSYVYHAEQASRRSLKNKKEIYARNRNIFEKRWGKLLRIFFYDQTINNENDFGIIYNSLKHVARERAIVKLWVKGKGNSGETTAVFKKNGFIRHADIGVKIIRGVFAWPNIIWEILTKKKRYDAIIIRKGFLHLFIRVLAAFRGSKVFFIDRDNIKSSNGEVFSLKEAALFSGYLRS